MNDPWIWCFRSFLDINNGACIFRAGVTIAPRVRGKSKSSNGVVKYLELANLLPTRRADSRVTVCSLEHTEEAPCPLYLKLQTYVI